MKIQLSEQIMENENLLKKVEELEFTSKDFGFYWDNLGRIMEQIRSECDEVDEAHAHNDRTHLQEEIGDLIHATLCLPVYFGMDPFETLKNSTIKYEKRLNKLKQFAKEDGHENLEGASFELMMHYWNKAKANT